MAVAGDFSGTISWGDGTTSTFTSANVVPVTALLPAVDQFAIEGGHTYAQKGIYQVLVSINDKLDGSVPLTNVMTLTVADAPLTASDLPVTLETAGPGAPAGLIHEGNPTGSVVVATFTDGDPNAAAGDYGVMINWGDTSTPTYYNYPGQANTVSADPVTLFFFFQEHVRGGIRRQRQPHLCRCGILPGHGDHCGHGSGLERPHPHRREQHGDGGKHDGQGVRRAFDRHGCPSADDTGSYCRRVVCDGHGGHAQPGDFHQRGPHRPEQRLRCHDQLG